QHPVAVMLDLELLDLLHLVQLAALEDGIHSGSSSSQNSSSKDLPSTRQMARHRRMVGLYSPFSIAWIVWRETPTAAARSPCVMSFSARAAFSFRFFAIGPPPFWIQNSTRIPHCQVYITFLSYGFTFCRPSFFGNSPAAMPRRSCS